MSTLCHRIWQIQFISLAIITNALMSVVIKVKQQEEKKKGMKQNFLTLWDTNKEEEVEDVELLSNYPKWHSYI